MAYQNVGTPRFYINVLEWLHSKGTISIPSRLMTLPVLSDVTGYATAHSISGLMSGGKNFHSALNYTASGAFQITGASYDAEIVNSDGEYSGFRISTFANDIDSITFEGGGGSLIAGTYYDMPHSPDLNLTMTREYGGIKTIETKGGASLSNDFGSSPPKWGTLGAWEVDTGNHALSRSGRRVWDLSFSYLQDSDVFAPTESQTPVIFDTDGYTQNTDWYQSISDDQDYWHQNMRFLSHDDFYTQVIHKTNGGQLPFIFQPDSSNNNPDQFAICKLDQNSFRFEQTAPNLYSVKLRIREVW